MRRSRPQKAASPWTGSKRGLIWRAGRGDVGVRIFYDPLVRVYSVFRMTRDEDRRRGPEPGFSPDYEFDTLDDALAMAHYLITGDHRTPRSNPANPPQANAAIKTFEGFHAYDHKTVEKFKREVKVPEYMEYAGPCLWVLYRSDKWNDGTHDYIHTIESYPKVKCCYPGSGGQKIRVPAKVRDATTVALLGLRALGFAYKQDGEEYEAKVPADSEWFWSPSAKALYCIGGRSRLLSVIWGGRLDVEPRGIVG